MRTEKCSNANSLLWLNNICFVSTQKRLRFRDLELQPEFNTLGMEDKKYLWSPRLDIVNAVGPVGRKEIRTSKF